MRTRGAKRWAAFISHLFSAGTSRVRWTSASALNDLVARRSTVLLDLNHTLAFHCDRFGRPEDFFATYREIGGSHLSPSDVNALVVATCDRLRTIGRDPSRFESFPRIEAVLAAQEPTRHLPLAEHDLLAAVIGLHEVGTIPVAHADGVRELASRFRLGLVSNMWAASTYCRDAIRDAGIDDCFESLVFSSDHGVTKPSRAIFDISMREMSIGPDDAVYVGNSLRRDVAGGQNAGIAVVWVNEKGEPTPEPAPAGVVADFPSFVKALG